jgi:hypothetical protein
MSGGGRERFPVVSYQLSVISYQLTVVFSPLRLISPHSLNFIYLPNFDSLIGATTGEKVTIWADGYGIDCG